MALFVYRIADGELVSWCPGDGDPVAPDAELQARGLAKLVGAPALDATHAWDAASKTVIDVAPANVARPIGAGRWIMRFTAAEFQAIRASSDPEVQLFMFALDHATEVDLTDPLITGGVAYLVSIGLLQQSRVAAILG